ncbi:MAG: beta-lactamase family protein, partial [Deltaproteobacteria bacterium]|nr:beta-lactamase family protein [Deltaproteobacteria bacterium]
MARPGLVLVVGLALACGSKQAGSDGPTPASQIDAGSADSTSNQAPEPTRAVALANRVEALVGRLGKPILELEDAPTALSVGVVAQGEEHYVGLGHLSEGGPAPGSDTLFHVASLTKPHTSLLVAQLVIEGKLKLDDPLPWCRRGRPRALCGKPKTTIRHLLTHSSGLRIVPSDGGGDYSPAKLRRYLARTRPPDRTPGQRFRYSTTGYG